MIHNTIKIALKLPGGNEIPPPKELTDKGFTNLAGFVSPLLTIALYIAAFLTFYYLVWGAFQYLMAGGNKEELAKARARITWAIVGLLVTVSAYLIATFGSEIFPPTRGGLPF